LIAPHPISIQTRRTLVKVHSSRVVRHIRTTRLSIHCRIDPKMQSLPHLSAIFTFRTKFLRSRTKHPNDRDVAARRMGGSLVQFRIFRLHNRQSVRKFQKVSRTPINQDGKICFASAMQTWDAVPTGGLHPRACSCFLVHQCSYFIKVILPCKKWFHDCISTSIAAHFAMWGDFSALISDRSFTTRSNLHTYIYRG
jgi:hypothetical protein